MKIQTLQTLPLLTLLVALLGFSSCEDRCESVKVGEAVLESITKSYAPYQEETTIQFSNDNGDLWSATVTRHYSTTDRNCVKYLCELFADPFAPVECEYYDTESIKNIYLFEGDSIGIDLTVAIMNYQEETTLFYDYLRVVMSSIGTLAYGESVPAVQFDDPVYDPSQVNILDEMEEIDMVELNGVIYQDLLQTIDSEDKVWLQSGKGVVAIEIDKVVWTLVE